MPTTFVQSGSKQLRWLVTGHRLVTQDGDVEASDQWDESIFIGDLYTTVRARNWTRTPNFKELKRLGQLPMNPLVVHAIDEDLGGYVAKKEEYLISSGPGNVISYSNNDRYPVRALYSPSYDRDLGALASATSKLVSRIKSRDAQWNAPVFFAEARKTVEMVLKTSRTLSMVLWNLRRGRLPAVFEALGLSKGDPGLARRYNRVIAKDPSKAASNAWLELQYGWTPLLSDVKSAAEVLASHAADNRWTLQKVSARSVMKETRYRSAPFTGTPIGDGSVTVQDRITDSARFTVHYRPSQPLDALGQIGLLNPALVAWELIPFSFVADWFLPIGNYLESLDVGLRYEFVRGIQSRKQEVIGVVTNVRSSGQWDGSPGTYRVVDLEATPLGGIPTPSVSDLVLEPKLGAKRILSSLALLRQNASRLTTRFL